MAVARPELELVEVRALLELIKQPPRTSVLYRARRELRRALERGEELEVADRERVRQMRARRRVPDFDEEPLLSNSVLRRAKQ